MSLYKLIPAIHEGTRIPYVEDFGSKNQLPIPYYECDPELGCTDKIPEYIEYRQVAVHKRLINVEIRYYEKFAFAISTGRVKVA